MNSIVNSNTSNNVRQDVYVTLGNFDGLHLGHLELINTVINWANSNNGASMVYSFKNHPLSLINKDIMPKLIMNNERKTDILKNLGIDFVELVEFNEEMMKSTPKEFVENLAYNYNVKGIVVGFNHRFGYKNSGDVNTLEELCESHNIELKVIDPYIMDGFIVSSSVIRKLISTGDICEAQKLLPFKYYLEGTVVKGKQLGRTIGFPTANLDFDTKYVIPEIGVYYTNVLVDGLVYKGITSVGNNPTVEDGNALTIETYLLDFDSDIYGRNIEVYFLSKMREEKKFKSLNDLKSQLIYDKNCAKKMDIIIK